MEAIAQPAVAGELLVQIPNKPDLPLFGQELRCAQIQMHVHAILILGVLVLEVVGEPERRREFESGLLVEVSIGAAGIDRIVADTEIGNARRIISAGRQISRNVGHEIIDAEIPPQQGLGNQIAETGHGFREAASNRKPGAPQAQVAHYCCIDASLKSSIGYPPG